MDKARLAPVAADALAFRAARSPHVCAFRIFGVAQSYSEVYGDLCKLAAALAEVPGVLEAQLIGVAHQHPGVELLLLFALEALGIATLPFVQPADAGIEAAVARCDLVIADQQLERLQRPLFLLSRQWIDEALKRKVSGLVTRPIPATATINVFTTSGSASAAKGIVFDSVRIDARIRSRLWQLGLEAGSQVLLGMPPNASAAYFIAQATLRAGATLWIADPACPLDDVTRCTHAIILPIHLRQLAEAARTPAPARPLAVHVVGARCSEQIRSLALERLNARVHEAYGTTETGWIVMMDDNHIGDVLPDVEVEVVDDARQPLAEGAPGEVRVRSAEMADGYLDANLTSERFDNGWYYSGDLGRMVGDRRLELLGRTDAMLNFGGLKVSAEVIEETLIQAVHAKDLAVASRTDASGIDTLVIFLADAKVSGDALSAAIARALGRNLGRIAVAAIAQIPRSTNGKVQRAVLASLARALPPSDAGLP